MPNKNWYPAHSPRRDNEHGHMVVQKNVQDLGDQFESFRTGVLGGSSIIPNGLTEVTVNHNLGALSYGASVVPRADLGAGIRFWIDNKTDSSFKIKVSAAVGADTPFDWVVKEA